MIFLSRKNNGSLAWVYARTKSFIPWIVLNSVLSVVSSVIMIMLAYVSKGILNSHGKEWGIFGSFLFASLCLLGLVILQLTIDALSSMINVRVQGRYIIKLRQYMFSSVLHKKYSKIFGTHSGDILNRFTSDIDTVAGGALGIIPTVFSLLSKIVVGGFALFLVNPYMAAGVLVIGFVFPLVGRMISKKFKHLHKEVQKSEGKSRAFIQESFSNIVVIKTFASETPIMGKLNEYMNANLRLKIRRNLYTVLVHSTLFSFFTFGYYGILIWGTYATLPFGDLYYYLQLVSILRAPLQNISSIIPTYYTMLASAERLIEIENIETEPDLIEDEKLKQIMKDFECIDVKNLAFAYENELVLKNCSFKIEKNQITAITGESGSGKSTLFKLILGLYDPTGGSLTFNGETNIDASTRGMFSYVPQTNMLLSGTIKDNITLCDPNISDEQIEKAAKAAVIYDFIKDLPNGFNTVLTERGGGLSEGQLQRISIARALLFNAPILLLDESTSALDEATETQLLSNIKHMTGKTVIFITHRHTSLSVCDRIIHVDDKEYKVIK